MTKMRPAAIMLGLFLLTAVTLAAAQADAPFDIERALEQTRRLLLDNPRIGEHGYLSTAELRARHEWELERSLSFPKLVRGNPENREIALTFDDGPHPGKTERLLRILRNEGVVATFFVVGKKVDEHPELVRREVFEGHEVANHTYNHIRLNSLAPALIAAELHAGSEAIRRAVGSPTRIFRPPGGEYDAEVIEVVKRTGYVMVLWTDDPGDYSDPGVEWIRTRTVNEASNGGIILLHDGVDQTLEALPQILRRLKQQGFRFVTVSEMARERGVIKTGGPRVP